MTKVKSSKIMAKPKLLKSVASRLFVYSFLKRIFIEEPSADLLKLIMQENLFEYFPFVDDNSQIKEGVEIAHFYLKDPDVLLNDSLRDLVADYINLFVGPGAMGAPPYESVYRSKRRWVFQKETMAVREEYLKQQLVSENIQREPDDHIALELDFMSHLCERSMSPLRKDQWPTVKKITNVQKRFYNNHLSLWAFDFSDNVGQRAQTDFYRGIGKILNGYLTLEKEHLSSLVEQLNLRIKKEKS